MEVSKRHWTPKEFEIPTGSCLFCGDQLDSKGGRAKEHAIPRWLLRHFDVEGQQINGSWMSATQEFKAKDIRTQNLGSLVQGKVCADCNGGWMSRLEVEAGPLLMSLANVERSVDLLTNAERRLLARWCVKTCAALNHASNFHPLVRPEHATAVESGPPVDGTFIFARQLGEPLPDPISWNQTVGAGPMLKPSDVTLEQILRDLQEGWRITVLIGRLLLLTTYIPPGEWLPMPNSATHTLLWPLGRPIPLQPEKTPLERKRPADELFYFQMELHMLHQSLVSDFGSVHISEEAPGNQATPAVE